MGNCCSAPNTLNEGKGAVQVFGMPPSANACSAILLAMHSGAGGFEMCDLMKGDQNKPEFLAMNPFHHIPTCKDGPVALGESNAILRYLALKYMPNCYPVKDICRCAMIDFAVESFSGDVYKKIAPGVFYPVFGFSGPNEDQAKCNKEATEAVDAWIKHFVKGKFACGDVVSIADFKAVPFLWATMQPGVEMRTGFKLSDRAKQYVEDFMAAVAASAFMKEAGGYSIAEYAAKQVPDGGMGTGYTKASLSATPAFGAPDGKVKVHGLPMSKNSCGPIIAAMEAGVGGMEFCDIMKGAQMTPEFLAMNPFHHVPTLQDGAFAIGESTAAIRYIALKYKPEWYPVSNPTACGKIDFACEAFGGDVYPKLGSKIIYPVFGFAGPPEEGFATAAKEATEILDTWLNHFVKGGKFVNGDSLSIADFKAVPFIFAAMQTAVETKTGFKTPALGRTYVQNFLTAVKASSFLSNAGGFSIAEYAKSKE